MKSISVLLIILLLLISNILYAGEVITLNDVTVNTIKTNEKLISLKTQIDISEITYVENYKKFIPDVSLKYEQQKQNNYQSTDMDNMSAYAEVSYIVKTSGETFISRDIEKIEILSLKNEYSKAKNEIIMSVVGCYYSLILKSIEIELNNDLMNTIKKQKEIALTERKLGMSTDLDVYKLDSKLYEAIYSEKKLKNELNDLAVELKTLSGIQFFGIPNIEKKIPTLSKMLINYEKMKTTRKNPNITNNYDIISNKNNLIKNGYSLILSNREMFPDVKIFTNYGYTGEEFPLNQKKWGVGATVSFSAFSNSQSLTDSYNESNNGTLKTRSQNAQVDVLNDPNFYSRNLSAKSSYKTTLMQTDALKEQVKYSIERQFNSIDEILEMKNIAEKNYDVINKQIAIEEVRRKTGEITHIDLINVYVEAKKAKMEVYNSQVNLINNMYKLHYFFGTEIINPSE